MTGKEIIEGNKLIAKFMGLKLPLSIQAYANAICLNNGHYHKSYDWLRPVIMKIKGMEKQWPIATNDVCTLFVWEDIDVIWLEVVKFIKWYNNE